MRAEERWTELARGQAAIRADAEAHAVERRWSHGGSWAASAQLHYNERFGFPPVRLRRTPPDDVEGWIEYGFDEHGRCVLVRQHAFGRSYQDEVFIHGDDRSELLHFHWVQDWARKPGDEEYKLVALEEQRRDHDGRLARWAQIVRGDRYADAESRVWWEEYHYRPDGAVDHIVQFRPVYDEREARAGLQVGDIDVTRDEFAYDDAGKLATIRRSFADAGADAHVVWRRRPASLRPALRKVEDTLVDSVASWAHEHWPDEPVYCVGLLYQPEHPLGLSPAIGSEREREAALHEPGEYGVGLELWNPAEFQIAPAFVAGRDDAHYSEAAALLEQEWRMTDDHEAGFKLLARVAKRLNADVRFDHPRTGDFVVFAMDPEIPDQAHIERHLRACIPKDTFKDLKRRALFYVEP